MSKPWRLATALGVFAVAAVGSSTFVILRSPVSRPRSTSRRRATSRASRSTSPCRPSAPSGSAPHPDLGLVPGQGRRRGSGCTRRCGRSRPTPGSTSPSTSTTRAARCATSRSARSPGTIGDVATLNGKTVPRRSTRTPATGSGHTFSIPTLGINVPLYGNNGNANLCAVAPCTHAVAQPGHQVLLHHARPGAVPLAVLRALRPGLPLRQRRSDADRRLHGRLLEGGVVSDARAEDGAAPGGRVAGRRRPRHEPHHCWRLIAIWVVLSAIVDPSVLLPRRAPRPAGRDDQHGRRGTSSTSTSSSSSPCRSSSASGSTWSTPSSIWRASRGGPEPVGGPPGPRQPAHPGRLDR